MVDTTATYSEYDLAAGTLNTSSLLLRNTLNTSQLLQHSIITLTKVGRFGLRFRRSKQLAQLWSLDEV